MSNNSFPHLIITGSKETTHEGKTPFHKRDKKSHEMSHVPDIMFSVKRFERPAILSTSFLARTDELNCSQLGFAL